MTHRIASVASAVLISASCASAWAQTAIDQPFSDGFEDLVAGVDVSNQPDPRWSSFGGVTGFGTIVDPDDEGIRGTTPAGRFGQRVLKFDSIDGGAHEQLIEQSRRAFNSTNLPLSFSGTLTVGFDIRTITAADPAPGAGNPNARVEVTLGGPRAGRVIFGDDLAGDGELRAVFAGGAGTQQAGGAFTAPFVSDPLAFGAWHNVRFGLNIADDRYTFIEINGTRFDNGGAGWDAGVNRFGSDDLNILNILQDAGSAQLDGVFLDNITVVPGPAAPAALFVSASLVAARRRRSAS